MLQGHIYVSLVFPCVTCENVTHGKLQKGDYRDGLFRVGYLMFQIEKDNMEESMIHLHVEEALECSACSTAQ